MNLFIFINFLKFSAKLKDNVGSKKWAVKIEEDLRAKQAGR
ncbi:MULTISPECIES: hypothetical protein [Flavobacterium]|nr:hypothetical protein [Flavobacterium sp. YO64]